MKNYHWKKIVFALFGIFLVGLGVAINASAKLGNDPIGLFYDGIRSAFQIPYSRFGTVSNFVNYGLIIILLFVGRKYLNIGTLIYILPYGWFVNLGTALYNSIVTTDALAIRVIATVFGCLFIYVGVGIFIAVNIGLDPFTGIVMVLADWFKWDYRKTKILFDFTIIIVGYLLGGTIGVITIITALTAGPCIQAISGWFSKRMKVS